jgi:hypothetical protein
MAINEVGSSIDFSKNIKSYKAPWYVQNSVGDDKPTRMTVPFGPDKDENLDKDLGLASWWNKKNPDEAKALKDKLLAKIWGPDGQHGPEKASSIEDAIMSTDDNTGPDETKEDKAIASKPEVENAVGPAQERALLKEEPPAMGTTVDPAIPLADGVPKAPAAKPFHPPAVKNDNLSTFRRMFNRNNMHDIEDAEYTILGNSATGAPSSSPAAALPASSSTPGSTAGPTPGSTPIPNTATGGGGAGGGVPTNGAMAGMMAGLQQPKAKSKAWARQKLGNSLIRSGSANSGNLLRLMGIIGGGVARAAGNIPAILDTAGAQQKAIYGNPNGAYGAIGKGVGDALGTGLEALGDMAGGIPESIGAGIADVGDEVANDMQLQALQNAMFVKMRQHIKWLQRKNVDLNRAGVWDYLKNFVNSYGLASLQNRKKP